MKIRFFLPMLLISSSIYAQHSDWIVSTSAKTHKQTVDALELAILDKGFTVFDIIDHAMGAERVGQNLSPTTVIIFGNPKAGTALMKCDQQMGIVLPLRILVWEDENEKVNVGFIDPEKYLKEFALDNCKETIAKIKLAMKNLLTTVEKK